MLLEGQGAAEDDEADSVSDPSSEDASDSESETDIYENADNLYIGQRRLTCQEAFEQEALRIQLLQSRRAQDGQPNEDETFSLAFSGGGIRAAAFQAGVLWRLAEENKLKDVEYLTAVSGGGYIAAAYVSHLVKAGRPRHGRVKDWYQKVVAKTMRRMEINSGDFVRDCVSAPCYSETPHAGVLPRFMDLPVLLVTVTLSMLVNPLTFVLCMLIPFIILVNQFFGAGMRASFCCSLSGLDWLDALGNYSYLLTIIYGLGAMILLAVVLAILKRILPFCSLQTAEEGSRRRKATFFFLFGHAASALLKRVIWLTILFMAFIVAVPYEERFQYSDHEASKYCREYIQQFRMDAAPLQPVCSDYNKGRLWYDHELFENYTKSEPGALVADNTGSSAERAPAVNALGWLCLFVAAALCFSICLMPIIGPALFQSALAIAGPLVLFGLCLMGVQYAVFGPVTGNRRGLLGHFNTEKFHAAVDTGLGFSVVLAPFYDDIRALLHHYYKRCIKVNFFADGEDVNLRQLGRHPYCPFLLLTATSNDFQPPDDIDKIAELSFSALHTGGEETGYYGTPPYRKLAKCAAISGAGCLDAITLSMSDALSLRFWLEVLNLSWGDYVILDHVGWSKLLSSTVIGKLYGGVLVRVVHRMPASLLWIAIMVMLKVVWNQLSDVVGDGCLGVKHDLWTIFIVFFAMFCLSFFSFCPPFDLLGMSPLLRQMQQVMRYFFVGEKPPRMLYMTDGGVKDCTSIVQLLWRRRKRILLVLAAADAGDDLSVLKAAFKVAEDLKLATFFDRQNPTAHLDILLERFKADTAATHLHVGISYCWDDPGTHGDLFIVKNRLPSNMARSIPVRPLITTNEVMQKSMDDSEASDASEELHERWGEMTVDQLGPFGCCDCCHTNGLNCGPKFPHGTFTGYLYLSPMWCSSLMRLGYAISRDAIAKVTGPSTSA